MQGEILLPLERLLQAVALAVGTIALGAQLAEVAVAQLQIMVCSIKGAIQQALHSVVTRARSMAMPAVIRLLVETVIQPVVRVVVVLVSPQMMSIPERLQRI